MTIFKHNYSGLITKGLGTAACCGMITMGFGVFVCEVTVIDPPPVVSGGGGLASKSTSVNIPHKRLKQISVHIRYKTTRWDQLYVVTPKTADMVVEIIGQITNLRRIVSVGIDTVKRSIKRITATITNDK